MTDFAGWVRFVDLPTAWFAVWVAVNAGLLPAVGAGVVPFDPFWQTSARSTPGPLTRRPGHQVGAIS